MTNQEQWKDIPDYEGRYQASNLGRIRSMRCEIKYLRADGTLASRTQNEMIRSQFLFRGRYHITLVKFGITRTILSHMLVAKAFIPNPHHYKYVIHIDGDITNNHVDNLRWCGQTEIRQFYANRRATKEKNK